METMKMKPVQYDDLASLPCSDLFALCVMSSGAVRRRLIAAFLSSLDREIAQSPDCIKPLSATRIDEARELTKGVEVSDDEALPTRVTDTL
jgi:hypothetical protein